MNTSERKEGRERKTRGREEGRVAGKEKGVVWLGQVGSRRLWDVG